MSGAGLLLPAALLLPAVAAMAGFVLGGRRAEQAALLWCAAGVALAFALLLAVLLAGAPVAYHLGGWAPPLGIALEADGLAAAMLAATALVAGGAALYARGEGGTAETRAGLTFWVMLPALWSAMAGILLGRDLFNLYVALELLTFAAVPLVALDGSRRAAEAALRYLMFALLGSVLYLLGCALLYGAHGTLDIAQLGALARPDPATLAAGALMTAGLLAKTALFPLHLWLPPAHAGAPPAVSALASALVVKGSFVLLLRLWFGALPALLTPAAGQVLAALGALAILAGSVVALREPRLKLLVAYSTVAQLGYLMLMVPLVAAGAGQAWTGGVLQAVSHAFAKAAMFLAAGSLAQALGHDRIAGLGGAARALPLSVGAFGLAGLTLMGVPPSGGFSAKWLLLTAAIETGQWWWAAVVVGGGLLTGGYLWRVLAAAGGPAAPDAPPPAPVPRRGEAVALALAVLSVLLGLLPVYALGLVRIGAP